LRRSSSGSCLTLIHPPLGDPTVPYHSTAYLAGSMIANGFGAPTQRDANAEFVSWCLSEPTFLRMVDEAQTGEGRLAAQGELSLDEQGEYYALWCRGEVDFAELAQAIATQKNLSEFLDFDAYVRSVQVICDYFDLIGALSYPGAIENFALVSNRRFSFTNFADLMNDGLSRRVCGLFYRFLDEVWLRDPAIRGTDCFGISVTYQHQLYHALALARWIREVWPEKKVVLGGTEIAQICRSVRDHTALSALFGLCDGMVVGEAETAICQMADIGFDLNPWSRIQNLMTYDPVTDEIHRPTKLVYEDLRSIAPPHYDIRWDQYLSPVRAINYSPTRGCYWNRCAFCSYGLNEDGPTAPWRVRPAELAARELAEICGAQGIGYVYFAVDTISPAYVERLADALIERGTDFKWSAEMRLEKVFPPSLCEKLARSGCVSALFGMESGSQRVLDRMDKGTKVEQMSQSIRHLAEVGIAVQLMTFSGFPTETAEDRADTFRFLQACSGDWSNGGMGSFVLVDGSIIAKEPKRFGLHLKSVDGCDIPAIRDFESVEDASTAPAGHDDDPTVAQGKSLFPSSFSRPWAGAADTLHSMVYYHHLGRQIFRDRPVLETPIRPVPTDDMMLARCTIRLHAGVGESRFDMRGLLATTEQWHADTALMERSGQAATHAAYAKSAARSQCLRRDESPRYYLQQRGKSVEVDKIAFLLLEDAVAHNRTVGEMCAALPPKASQRFLSYLRKLGGLGLVEFVGEA